MSKRISVKLPGRAPITLDESGALVANAALLDSQIASVLTASHSQGPAAMAPMADATWSGELGFENEYTGDGRFINKGALFFDEEQLPMPLRWAPTDVGAHGGAVVVGLINTLSVENGVVKATGILDLNSEYGQQVYAGLQKGTIKGVSLDLDDVAAELRVKKEIYDEYQKMFEADEDDAPEEKEGPEVSTDDEGAEYVKVAEYASDDEISVVTSARIRAATLVDIPAFRNAYVALDGDMTVGDSDQGEPTTAASEESVTASAAPLAPPMEWMTDPKLNEPTPITITDDGRIFGHIALWGTCHTGIPGQCVTPPASQTNYSWFRTGALLTAEGEEVPVGHITMSTGHAPRILRASAAAAHYDDTGVVAADVAAGEDGHGIWIAGALRSTLSDEQIRELRSAPMSGDWRTVGGNLELVAVLGVNMPGFPVPRVKTLTASGRPQTLLHPAVMPTRSTEKAPEYLNKAKEFASDLQKIRHSSWAKEVGE